MFYKTHFQSRIVIFITLFLFQKNMLIKLRSAAINQLMAGIVCASSGMILSQPAIGQTTLPLNDLSAFKPSSKSWVIASDVAADLSKANSLNITKGSGVLVNLPDKKATDLFTNLEHGDIDLELEYLMAKGANSGIYLQGRYEFQLLDSWNVTNPKSGDNGGIYQRWDDSKPEGQKGFEGHAPRQNASKAPGLWQKLKISFQAPRFDASGRKIANAKILRAELNGVTIHEDVELSGPTRGAMANDEKATGPLRIQGDHGAVAFRNIKITAFDKPRPELTDIKYTVYGRRYHDTINISQLPPEAQGPLGNLSATAINNLPAEFFIKYTGTLKVQEAGDYSIGLFVPGGRGILKINGKAVSMEGRSQRGTVNLPAGNLPFEMLYAKNQDWGNRAVAMGISGPGIREFVIGDVVTGGNSADPILVDAPNNTLLRSFMDIPGKRVVHAISVGSSQQVHYTYDLDHGALVQVWRGGFLDATPMWYSRGDGSSRPLGAVQRLGNPAFTLARLASADATWTIDTAGSGYVPKGYKLDKADLPTFRYQVFGAVVEDAVKALENGEGIRRDIAVQNAGGGLYARLAEGSQIESAGKGLYTVDGKAYYVRIDDDGGAKPVVRSINGRQELIVPVQSKLSYSILF